MNCFERLLERVCIGRVLKHPNRRNSGRACAETFRSVCFVHSANRNHRNSHRSHTSASSRDAVWRAERHSSTEYRRSARSKCSSLLRFPRLALLRGCGRKLRSENPRGAFPARHHCDYFSRGARRITQMHTRCAGRQRHVEPVVDDYARGPARRITASRASASSSRACKSFSRICTQSTPAATAARIFSSSAAHGIVAARALRSVT